MNYKILISSILFIFFISLSCVNSENKNSESNQAEPEETLVNETHHQEGELRLNQGKKWKANPETTQGIIAMEEHLDAFRNLGLSEYEQLRVNLEIEFKTIFEKCTMTGESHDQLHHFLFPMRELFEKLSQDTESAEKAFLALEDYLPNYFEYFE